MSESREPSRTHPVRHNSQCSPNDCVCVLGDHWKREPTINSELTVDPTPKNERLMIHVEGLQVTLTKRNEQIVRLQAKIVQLEEGTATNAEVTKAYGKGWKACAEAMASAAHDAANVLHGIRSAAFRQSSEGERLMRPTVEGEQA